MTEEDTFTYFPLGKALKNKQKRLMIKEKKQIKSIEEHEKQLAKSNAFSKKEESIPLDKEKEIFYNLVVKNYISF